MIRRRLWAAVLLAAVGCQTLDRVGCQLETANEVLQSTAESKVDQIAGGDAVNVSPTVAVTGSGALAIVVMLLLTRDLRRVRRTLATVIKAVERLDDPAAPHVKHQISRQALSDGTADYLHRVVKALEGGISA